MHVYIPSSNTTILLDTAAIVKDWLISTPLRSTHLYSGQPSFQHAIQDKVKTSLIAHMVDADHVSGEASGNRPVADYTKKLVESGAAHEIDNIVVKRLEEGTDGFKFKLARLAENAGNEILKKEIPFVVRNSELQLSDEQLQEFTKRYRLKGIEGDLYDGVKGVWSELQDIAPHLQGKEMPEDLKKGLGDLVEAQKMYKGFYTNLVHHLRGCDEFGHVVGEPLVFNLGERVTNLAADATVFRGMGGQSAAHSDPLAERNSTHEAQSPSSNQPPQDVISGATSSHASPDVPAKLAIQNDDKAAQGERKISVGNAAEETSTQGAATPLKDDVKVNPNLTEPPAGVKPADVGGNKSEVIEDNLDKVAKNAEGWSTRSKVAAGVAAAVAVAGGAYYLLKDDKPSTTTTAAGVGSQTQKTAGMTQV